MQRPQSNRIKFIWILCAIGGLVLGLVVGLALSRVFLSWNTPDSVYADLEPDSQVELIVLVAAAYSQDQDLARAQAILDRLGPRDIEQTIVSVLDRYVAEAQDPAVLHTLAQLAYALGNESPAIVAYLATPTPPPTDTPQPTPTLAPTRTPALTDTPRPPTRGPTALPPTATIQPSNTPTPLPTPTNRPSDTAIPQTPTVTPSDTPQPTDTARPRPTATPQPSATASAKWAYVARLVGPGEDAQTCSDGLKLIRVTVLDAAGNQIPGVWVHEQYTDLYQVSGHKGEDPFWGPGEIEFSGLDGGRLCVATGQGEACESDRTRDLPTHDPPPLEDLWAAGYCACCEPEITLERCRELFEAGKCLGISHYAWRVEFKREQ